MAVVVLYDRILGGLGAVRDLLDDRARTGATLVTTPDRAGFAELRRLRSWTAMATIRLDAVIVNGVLPDLGEDGPAAQWIASARAAQCAVVDEIREQVTETPVAVCERRGSEPIGLLSLGEMTSIGEMAQRHRDDRDPSQQGSDVEPVRISHDTGTGWTRCTRCGCISRSPIRRRSRSAGSTTTSSWGPTAFVAGCVWHPVCVAARCRRRSSTEPICCCASSRIRRCGRSEFGS